MVRREALLCGQARDPSVWSGAGSFCVVRREALLCGQTRVPFVWLGANNQARGPFLWPGTRPFCVVRRGAFLCGQARDPPCAGPIATAMVAMVLGRPCPHIGPILGDRLKEKILKP